jgi:hypothetical protein
MSQVASGRRIQILIALFLLLAIVAFAGEGLGWFETPLPVPFGESESSAEDEVDLRATRAACRFGVAISKAGTRGRARIDPDELADAYAEGFSDLPDEDRAQIRNACLEGVHEGLESRRGPEDD